jgi:glyoxylase-like metal-dependent hydrolase (beta-lactamase superfamily II)
MADRSAIHLIDVHYLGKPGGIAACVLETAEGLIIVDPGPTSSLDGLKTGMAGAGLDFADTRFLLLTHIHLDHAGVAGTIVQANPDVTVYVHPRGAVHLADPSRLMASALRIYGDSLDRLFGDFLPVPPQRIIALADDGTIAPGGRNLRVRFVPGHASHHAAFLDDNQGTVFLGDTAGERFAPSPWVLPVTPPPDIDLEAWSHSIARIREWNARSLFITHFGEFDDVNAHLDRLESGLADWSERVRRSLDEPGTDEERALRFQSEIRDGLASQVEPDVLPHFLSGGGIRDSWFGLARYWRKRS